MSIQLRNGRVIYAEITKRANKFYAKIYEIGKDKKPVFCNDRERVDLERKVFDYARRF